MKDSKSPGRNSKDFGERDRPMQNSEVAVEESEGKTGREQLSLAVSSPSPSHLGLLLGQRHSHTLSGEAGLSEQAKGQLWLFLCGGHQEAHHLFYSPSQGKRMPPAPMR